MIKRLSILGLLIMVFSLLTAYLIWDNNLIEKTTQPRKVFIPTPVKKYIEMDGGTFDVSITVFITKDTSLVREYSSTMDFNSSACTADEDGVIMVWFPSYPSQDLLTHEMTHVNEFILHDVGVPHSEDTDEVYAYEMGYLIKEFYKKTKHD
ncbi:MAG: hypothetical protein WCP46_00545 [Alphaproteobacteria bacterium]